MGHSTERYRNYDNLKWSPEEIVKLSLRFRDRSRNIMELAIIGKDAKNLCWCFNRYLTNKLLESVGIEDYIPAAQSVLLENDFTVIFDDLCTIWVEDTTGLEYTVERIKDIKLTSTMRFEDE